MCKSSNFFFNRSYPHFKSIFQFLYLPKDVFPLCHNSLRGRQSLKQPASHSHFNQRKHICVSSSNIAPCGPSPPQWSCCLEAPSRRRAASRCGPSWHVSCMCSKTLHTVPPFWWPPRKRAHTHTLNWDLLSLHFICEMSACRSAVRINFWGIYKFGSTLLKINYCGDVESNGSFQFLFSGSNSIKNFESNWCLFVADSDCYQWLTLGAFWVKGQGNESS